MDVLPYIMAWQWAAFLVCMIVLGVGAAVAGLRARSAGLRRISVWVLAMVGVLLTLFSMMWLVAMYVPGGAWLYEARQIVLLGCVAAALASFVAAYVVSRRAKEAKKA